MTTLLAWTGIDTHGPASVYIASDSRISWGSGRYWNVGRKVFASKTRPEVFGYCGAVTFPIQILGQLVDLIDLGLFFSESDSYDSKLEKVIAKISDSYRNLPISQHEKCQIFYASRVGSRMSSTFHAATIDVNRGGVSASKIDYPKNSGIIAMAGTGKPSLAFSYEEWIGPHYKDPSQLGRTSRSVFGAFCDALASGKDPYSGGAPQLVGLYRAGAAKAFGIIYNGSRYINGLEVSVIPGLNSVEWRNNLFERCCGENMEILKSAQRQPRPRNS